MIVLDASVLIGFAERPDVHHDAAVELLRRSVGQDLAASPVTWADFLVGSARRGDDFVPAAERWLASAGIRQVPLDDASPAALARLRVETRLPMPDCCVLHAAQRVGGSIATFDTRLQRVATDLGIAIA